MTALPLAGRVAVVTGATGGLGGALARQLAEAGAHVVACGRKPRKLETLHSRCAADGIALQLYPLDLEGAAPADLEQLVADVLAEYGRLDLLVHCAADFPGLTPLALADPAAVARALHVNLTARIWLTQAALPALAATAGRVEFVVDAAVRGGQPYWGGYGLAQAAQHALVSMLQAEQGAAGVQVGLWQPSPMPTALRARAYSHETETVSAPDAAARAWLAALCGRASRAAVDAID